mgnify:CR=1 FL=1
MKSTKYKAFTLSEMLVVLVVSSLVIAIAFSVLSMVRKQIITLQKNYGLKKELRSFELTFARDINTRSAICFNTKNNLFLKGVDNNIRYQFLDSIVIREEDTLKIPIKNKTFFYLNVLIHSPYYDVVDIKVLYQYVVVLNPSLYVF